MQWLWLVVMVLEGQQRALDGIPVSSLCHNRAGTGPRSDDAPAMICLQGALVHWPLASHQVSPVCA